jgi:hypothetical protein
MDEPIPGQPYDAADPEQVERQKQAAARHAKAMRVVVATLMATQDGRAWVWGQLVNCHIFQPSFVPGDSHATAFRDGERNSGLRILADVMSAAPELYVMMAKEASNG